MIQNEFKMIFNAFRFRSRTLSMFSNALKVICNAFERFQNALKWKNGSTEFSLSLVFPNRVTIQIQGYHYVLGPESGGFPEYHELVPWFLSQGKK